MYREFFGLQEPPFNLTPDPRFLYMSRRHREALAALVYGIKERKGFIAITGDIGSGKTTLCRAFLRELNAEATNVALVLNSFLNDLELLQTINDELGLDSKKDSKKDLIDGLNRYLLEQNELGKTTILIVDEAQNLSPTALEQIRMLSNLETEQCKLIQIVLIGQPELADILLRPDLEQLNQRITVRCHIGPLQKEEIYHYVRHRLHVAGAKINISLTPAALNRLHNYSGGIPRKINLLCDRALLAAYVAGRFQVDARMIALAEKELRNLGSIAPKPIRPFGEKNPRPQLAMAGAVFVVALAACFWIGLQLGMMPGANKGRPAAARYESPGNPWNDSFEMDAPFSYYGDDATTRPLRIADFAAPKPPPPPVPVEELAGGTTHTLDREWTWDANDVARVGDADLAYPACLLTVARLWQYAFDLELFRPLDKKEILGLNLPQIFRAPQIALGSFESGTDLDAMIALDLPLVFRIRNNGGPLSPSVTLTRVKGGKAIVADPRWGLVEMDQSALEEMVESVTVIFADRDNLMELVPGEESEAALALRTFLAREGVWEGGASGRIFDDEMAAALKRFQKKRGLEETGKLDGPTVATIATQRESYRPRLFSDADRKSAE